MRFPIHYLHYLLLPLLTLPLSSAYPQCSPVRLHEPHYPKRNPFNAADCTYIINHFPINGFMHHTLGQKPITIRTPARLTHGSCEITIIPSHALELDYPRPPYGSDLSPEWWDTAKVMALGIMLSCSARRMGGFNEVRLDHSGPYDVTMRVTVHQWELWGGETYRV